jgi:hypothetical protein
MEFDRLAKICARGNSGTGPIWMQPRLNDEKYANNGSRRWIESSLAMPSPRQMIILASDSDGGFASTGARAV